MAVMFSYKYFIFILLIKVLPNSFSANDEQKSIRSSQASLLVFHFEPSNEIYVNEDEQVNISFSVQTKPSDIFTATRREMFVRAVPSRQLHVFPSSFEVAPDDFRNGFNRTVQVRGVELGHVKLQFYCEPEYTKLKNRNETKKLPNLPIEEVEVSGRSSTEERFHNTVSTATKQSAEEVEENIVIILKTYDVHVLRVPHRLYEPFKFFLGIFILVNITMMGCEVRLPTVRNVLKKPIGPSVGFVSQFVFMPLASYGLGQVLLKDNTLRLGLFILGCSPGGKGSNMWTLILHGDINLSITMTFISTIAAMFMMPLWLYTLGETITSQGNITVAFQSLMVPLVSFCVPVSIGVAIRHFRPTWAKVAQKVVRSITIGLIIAVNVLGILTSTYVFKIITWRVIVCGLCIGWGGYAFGALSAWAFRLSRPQIIAVSIETAFQNGGIVFMILVLTLKQPDADLSLVAPLTQLVLTDLILFVYYIIYMAIPIMKRCLCLCIFQKNLKTESHEKEVCITEPLTANGGNISVHVVVKSTADVENNRMLNVIV